MLLAKVNFNVDDCEILWSSLRIVNRKTLYVLSFYRPPNSSTEILDHLGDSLRNAMIIAVMNAI